MRPIDSNFRGIRLTLPSGTVEGRTVSIESTVEQHTETKQVSQRNKDATSFPLFVVQASLRIEYSEPSLHA